MKYPDQPPFKYVGHILHCHFGVRSIIMLLRPSGLLFHMLVLSQVDYGFGILTLSKTQLLDVIQNEGIKAIVAQKDTAAAAMRYVPGYPAMQERHRLAHIKAASPA